MPLRRLPSNRRMRADSSRFMLAIVMMRSDGKTSRVPVPGNLRQRSLLYTQTQIPP
jgi:hypothetical protein